MKFKYLNYKGETEERNVTPIVWGWLEVPGFGYKPGWFLHAFDLDRQATRTFSMASDRMMPSDMAEFDDGGQMELFKFPTEIEIKFFADLSLVREAVAGLERAVHERLPPSDQYTPVPKQQFCYRNKNEPNLAFVSGPVDELPYAVKTNRDAFDVWVMSSV